MGTRLDAIEFQKYLMALIEWWLNRPIQRVGSIYGVMITHYTAAIRPPMALTSNVMVTVASTIREFYCNPPDSVAQPARSRISRCGAAAAGCGDQP